MITTPYTRSHAGFSDAINFCSTDIASFLSLNKRPSSVSLTLHLENGSMLSTKEAEESSNNSDNLRTSGKYIY